MECTDLNIHTRVKVALALSIFSCSLHSPTQSLETPRLSGLYQRLPLNETQGSPPTSIFYVVQITSKFLAARLQDHRLLVRTLWLRSVPPKTTKSALCRKQPRRFTTYSATICDTRIPGWETATKLLPLGAPTQSFLHHIFFVLLLSDPSVWLLGALSPEPFEPTFLDSSRRSG